MDHIFHSDLVEVFKEMPAESMIEENAQNSS